MGLRQTGARAWEAPESVLAIDHRSLSGEPTSAVLCHTFLLAISRQKEIGRIVSTLSPRGILIAMEGIDGAGKTTQVEALRDAFIRAGETPVVSKEPTDGPWGRKIRESAANGRMPVDEELTAFVQDRTEHVAQVIVPALSKGKIVILDRYFYSTIAYQGCRGVDHVCLERLMESQFPVPDVVFVIDLDPRISIDRIHHFRKDTPNEFEQLDGLRKAREIFRSLRGDHIKVVDGELGINDLHGSIVEAVVNGPLKQKRCAKSYGCHDLFFCWFRLTESCEWLSMRRALMAGADRYRNEGLRA